MAGPDFERQERLRIGDIDLLLENRYDPLERRLHTDYTFMRDGRTVKRPTSQRLYSFDELCRLLEDAGFGGFEGYGLLDAHFEPEPSGGDADRLLLLASRK